MKALHRKLSPSLLKHLQKGRMTVRTFTWYLIWWYYECIFEKKNWYLSSVKFHICFCWINRVEFRFYLEWIQKTICRLEWPFKQNFCHLYILDTGNWVENCCNHFIFFTVCKHFEVCILSTYCFTYMISFRNSLIQGWGYYLEIFW
jgi:hypothetical protein